ncbi:MAG: hypothetical protein LBM98_10305 [Oscillospiraceae bacterium]|nr:hypothetical protein [Oscillospiraceae bacterium]
MFFAPYTLVTPSKYHSRNLRYSEALKGSQYVGRYPSADDRASDSC